MASIPPWEKIRDKKGLIDGAKIAGKQHTDQTTGSASEQKNSAINLKST